MTPPDTDPADGATEVAPPPEPEEVEDLRLEAPEDRHDRAEWEAAAAAVLRKAGRLGADEPDARVWELLGRTTLEGIAVPPLGTADLLDDLATAGRPTRAGAWDVRTPLVGGDAAALREEALADLDAGATSLLLRAEPGTDLGAALQGVLLDLAPVTLDRATPEQSGALADLLAAYDGTPDARSNLSADPLAARLRSEDPRAGDDPADPADSVVAAARRAAELGVMGLVVDATALHDRGAGDAQELGWSMAAGIAYLRLLADAGVDVEEAARLVEFRYAATDEQFPTIAKLRAARRLWARVLELSGVEDAEAVGQRQHAVTSRPMMSRYDPWVNMLRTTVAAFAAGVGGADAVTVLPFDSPLGRPDAFARRIARNTSALLVEESHVAVVADPAGGAYAVERLTDDLAVAAWAELGRIEESGGALAALDDGSVLARVAEVARRRDEAVATRRRPLTGLSEFPNLAEALPDREGPGDDVRRYGAAFEALRDDPPDRSVFLATMGPVAAHTARATFATNLFAAGGVAVDPAGATADVDAVLAAYDGQPVACLAGTDAAYAEWGADLAAALREAGARRVVVAGKPFDGVDDHAAMGVDALAFLTRTREALA